MLALLLFARATGVLALINYYSPLRFVICLEARIFISPATRTHHLLSVVVQMVERRYDATRFYVIVSYKLLSTQLTPHNCGLSFGRLRRNSKIPSAPINQRNRMKFRVYARDFVFQPNFSVYPRQLNFACFPRGKPHATCVIFEAARYPRVKKPEVKSAKLLLPLLTHYSS